MTAKPTDDFMEGLYTEAPSEREIPRDERGTLRAMAVPSMCSSSEELEAREAAHFANRMNLLPMVFRNEDGTPQPLDALQRKQIAELGFSSREFWILQGYTDTNMPAEDRENEPDSYHDKT